MKIVQDQKRKEDRWLMFIILIFLEINGDMKIVQAHKRKVDRSLVFIIFIFLEKLRQPSLMVI